MIKAIIAGLVFSLLALPRASLLYASQKKEQTQDPIQKVLASGTDQIPKGVESGGPELMRRNPRYHVESGDVLDLNFTFTPEFNQSVAVQPDGFITLRSVGDLHVQGKTVPEIRTEIRKAYNKILRHPSISISLKNFEEPYFLALGQVQHPGKYQLRGDTTIAEAVSVAGGFTQKAKNSQVLVFRRVSDNWASVQKVNLKHMLRHGNLREDLQLHPGDMIYVPQNTISKVKPFIPLPSLSMWLWHP